MFQPFTTHHAPCAHSALVPRFVIALAFILFSITPLAASQTEIPGPDASSFGEKVTVLPNGNIVVIATLYDIPAGAANVGAVYLYDGATLALISTLVGGTANDNVGSGDVTVLSNGNYVIVSPTWDNPSPAAANAGAVTWCSATTGCGGTVSAANSLVGGSANDTVGADGITVLTNGNYVVSSELWDNPSTGASNAGAVTWGSGTTGISGTVSSSNSLVSTTENFGQSSGVTALTNGNYVVRTPSWSNPDTGITFVGAVTWGSGTTGISGTISPANSLVGSTFVDKVGEDPAGLPAVVALTNGNYVVRSPQWGTGTGPGEVWDPGAVTWGSGTTGISGVVSSSNSLIGGITAGDVVGSGGVTALTNGNYVVCSPSWTNLQTNLWDVGAATWGSGTTGISGVISPSNSLVGSAGSDGVCNGGVTALPNGNYVVSSTFWGPDRGAVTWGRGTTGTSGVISSANSLVGTSVDSVGTGGVRALTNGNYIVSSPNWGSSDAGAVTWANGGGGTVGLVSATNSLVGSTTGDNIGSGGVTALTNGSYVVSSPLWGSTNFGAATWGNGTTALVGTVSPLNSLVGSSTNDEIGFGGVTALTNGNYVVNSPNWGSTNFGAVTWGSGTTGISGAISSSNSLVGSTADDRVGGSGVTALTNGNYVVRSVSWGSTDVGAVTWGSGAAGISGAVSSSNSLVGSTAQDLVGFGGVTALSNGNYIVYSERWDNPQPAITDARAVTFGNGAGGTSGVITNGATGGNSVTTYVSSFAFDATRNRLFVGRGPLITVSILSFNTTAVADGDLNNPAIFDNGLPNGLVNAVIPGGRTVTISSVMNVGQIYVRCGGGLSGGSASAYVVGSVRKDYCGAAAVGESFTFPIGDADDYSPVRTTNVSGTGFLTASVTDTTLAGLPPTLSVSRFWTLQGAGITTDLAFTYVDADVNSFETAYKVYRRSTAGITTRVHPSTINAATNTATVTGVSSFSDWGIGNLFPPTAASVSVGGRIVTANGAGLSKARVTLTDAQGNTRQAISTSFGYYRFDGVPVGQTVVVSVDSKQNQSATQILNVTEDIGNLDFTAAP